MSTAISIICMLLLSVGPLFAQHLGAWEEEDGLRQLNALARSYPQRISQITRREGQWVIRVANEWFYWASARLLPADQAHEWRQYSSVRFYNYPRGPVRAPQLSIQQEDQLRRWLRESRQRPPRRHNGFLDNLYGISSRSEAEQLMITQQFMGFTFRINPLIQQPLLHVERDLRNLTTRDARARRFFASIATMHGYNWRNIAGTQSRSYHAYGIALDFVPLDYSGKYAYWRWAVDQGYSDWWRISPEQRWMIPDNIVAIFERHGFIWGGKWLFFDALHFEYRPELLLLSP